jgi:hypothetical protein
LSSRPSDRYVFFGQGDERGPWPKWVQARPAPPWEPDESVRALSCGHVSLPARCLCVLRSALILFLSSQACRAAVGPRRGECIPCLQHVLWLRVCSCFAFACLRDRCGCPAVARHSLAQTQTQAEQTAAHPILHPSCPLALDCCFIASCSAERHSTFQCTFCFSLRSRSVRFCAAAAQPARRSACARSRHCHLCICCCFSSTNHRAAPSVCWRRCHRHRRRPTFVVSSAAQHFAARPCDLSTSHPDRCCRQCCCVCCSLFPPHVLCSCRTVGPAPLHSAAHRFETAHTQSRRLHLSAAARVRPSHAPHAPTALCRRPHLRFYFYFFCCCCCWWCCGACVLCVACTARATARRRGRVRRTRRSRSRRRRVEAAAADGSAVW